MLPQLLAVSAMLSSTLVSDVNVCPAVRSHHPIFSGPSEDKLV